MNWLVKTFSSSIGKKLMMAVTGLCFIGFLMVHLAGNLTVTAGGEVFNAYAAKLHSLGAPLLVMEFVLLALAVVHVITGLYLFYRNVMARPQRYAVNRNAGGRTLGSATMPYTGVVILAFLVIHLTNFTFVDKTGTTIFQIVSNAFQNPVTVLFYTLVMVVVALHVSHGLWSALQTIGANHPKYMPVVMAASLIFAVVVGIGFGFLPIYFSLIA
ncbi:MAG: succinate dehydrogenase cytochrome b subunit [Desulfobacteraceae bacterium]|nr:succinate dehydrogenase cytochrome b subunit [Desulfobacteraceae bacterium]